ncbi:cell division protein FtsL, partial [Rhodovarius lipocyclicus]|uniref:cell division protein FtsL n=1 Tax=Rhodovarius lipocyclicus TaxID=268410 RepID=UPI0038B49142
MIIRLPTLVGALGLALAASHTYQVKQSVKALEGQLRDIRRQTEEAQERTQNLQAEWARLNDQDRLRGLAERQLPGLVPMQSSQFTQLAEAARRLPVAVAFAGPAGAFAPRQDNVALADAAPAPAQAAPSQPGPAP